MVKISTAVAQAVANFKSENHRAALQAIADELADRLPRADHSVAAAIAKQLAQTLADIAALPAPEGDPVAAIQQRRAERPAPGVARRVDVGGKGAAVAAPARKRRVAGDGA